jgi:hypothetical protein
MLHIIPKWVGQEVPQGQPVADLVKMMQGYADRTASGPAVQHAMRLLEGHKPKMAHGVMLSLGLDSAFVEPVVSLHLPKDVTRKMDKSYLKQVEKQVGSVFPGVRVAAEIPHPKGNTLAMVVHPQKLPDPDDILKMMFEKNVPVVYMHTVSSGSLKVPRIIAVKGLERWRDDDTGKTYVATRPSDYWSRIQFPGAFGHAAKTLRDFSNSVAEKYGSLHPPYGGVFHSGQL